MFGPYDAVNGFGGSISDGATGKRLLMRFGLTIVAFGFALADDGDLTQISCGATFYQRNVGGQTHPVDMRPSGAVVQCVHHEVKLLEETHAVFISKNLKNPLKHLIYKKSNVHNLTS